MNKIYQKLRTVGMRTIWRRLWHEQRKKIWSFYQKQIFGKNTTHQLFSDPISFSVIRSLWEKVEKQKKVEEIGSSFKTNIFLPKNFHELDPEKQYAFLLNSHAPLTLEQAKIKAKTAEWGLDILWDLNEQEDLRFLWEPSRFQWLIPLVSSYDHLSSKKEQKEACQNIVSAYYRWIEIFPPLHGIAWMCPMEVALRSLSLLYAASHLYTSPFFPLNFWKEISSLLYTHYLYLRNCLEYFDRQNNHLVCDAVGLLWLSRWLSNFFFSARLDERKARNILKEQYSTQLLSDGGWYEGSTSYHALMLESLMYVLPFIEKEKEKTFFTSCAKRMKNFWLSTYTKHKESIRIGDDDGGIFFKGVVPLSLPSFSSHQFFPKFGLATFKNKQFEVYVRTPSFMPYQPSGHFHYDELSFTLAVEGNIVVTDPGTYLYTKNKSERCFFRSRHSHNGPYVPSHEKPESPHLFHTTKTIHTCTSRSKCCSEFSWKREVAEEVFVERSIKIESDRIIFTDKVFPSHLFLKVNLTFASNLQLRKHKKNTYEITDPTSSLLSLKVFGNQLISDERKSYVSPTYGTKIETATLFLTARRSIEHVWSLKKY